MLRVEHVNAGYGDVQVLWDVSFQVQTREFVVLVGANGAGKSTIMRTISNIIHPKSGAIWFEDQRIDRTPPYRVIHHGIAHVPEGRQLFPEMSVVENLELGSLTPDAKAHRKETLDWVLTLFPRLRERQKQMAGTLSGGEQQMCAIARGLMSKPRLLMLDELSLGLMPALVEKVLEAVVRVNRRGTTVLLVEQMVQEALEIAARGYVIQTGRIVQSGPARDLLESEEVRKAYMGM